MNLISQFLQMFAMDSSLPPLSRFFMSQRGLNWEHCSKCLLQLGMNMSCLIPVIHCICFCAEPRTEQTNSHFHILRGHSFSTYAKFSEKLTFLTLWYAHVVRVRGWEIKFFGKNCVRTKWMIHYSRILIKLRYPVTLDMLMGLQCSDEFDKDDGNCNMVQNLGD